VRTRRSLRRPKLVVENPGLAEQEQAAQTGQTTDTQSDTDDIEALWEDDGLGDPLTTTHVHNIPVGKPKDSSGRARTGNTAKRPGSTPTNPRTSLACSTSSLIGLCGIRSGVPVPAHCSR
jgi:hypothetical protein